MNTSFILGRDAIPAVELREYDNTQPARPTVATTREIDFSFDETRGELDFFFSRADFRTPVPDHTTDLVPLLRRIRDNDPTFGWDDTNQKEPRVPFASRLSLRNAEWCYVIIRLADSKNWQFCSTQPPFTLGTKAFKADIYREARRFANGVAQRVYQQPADSGDFGPVADDSRVAYFIADNRASGNFVDHAFNIHVELKFRGSHVRLPVVIDPDIRWPGGSGA